MDEPSPDHFEMRRLESLSNTIFGVAMTLLAYDLPRAAQFSAAPTWGELAHLYAARLIALTLSFLIAGLFWYSHHRRLMRQPYGSRPVVFINLFFLLSIILLPVTSGLDGSYGQSSVIAVLYGLHLSTIAALNAWLWWIATRDRRSRHELRRALFPHSCFCWAPWLRRLPRNMPDISGCLHLAVCCYAARCPPTMKWRAEAG
jgi:uncharacterized membrane protein